MAPPYPAASSFAAAFTQRLGAREELRGGAPVPPQYAAGWPTLDGRTLSASFLDTASQRHGKQARSKQCHQTRQALHCQVKQCYSLKHCLSQTCRCI